MISSKSMQHTPRKLSKQNLDALRVLSQKSPLFALLRALVERGGREVKRG